MLSERNIKDNNNNAKSGFNSAQNSASRTITPFSPNSSDNLTNMNLNSKSKDKTSIPTYKVVLTGKSGVGKSKIISNFTGNVINSKTVGTNFYVRQMEVNNKPIRLEIWDTSGDNNLRTLVNSFYKNAHAVLVIFDSSDPISLYEVNFWEKEIKTFLSEQCIRYIVKNKIDLITDKNSLTNENTSTVNNPTGELNTKKEIMSHVTVTDEEEKFFELNYTEKFAISALYDVGVENMFKVIANDLKQAYPELVEKKRVERESVKISQKDFMNNLKKSNCV